MATKILTEVANGGLDISVAGSALNAKIDPANIAVSTSSPDHVLTSVSDTIKKGTIASLNIGNVASSLTGILKATAGVLSAASAGSDYAAVNHTHATTDITGLTAAIRVALSGTSPIGYDNSTGVISLTQTAITNVSSALSTGLLKVTTGTGALSVASAGVDFAAASHSHAASAITGLGVGPYIHIEGGVAADIPSSSNWLSGLLVLRTGGTATLTGISLTTQQLSATGTTTFRIGNCTDPSDPLFEYQDISLLSSEREVEVTSSSVSLAAALSKKIYIWCTANGGHSAFDFVFTLG